MEKNFKKDTTMNSKKIDKLNNKKDAETKNELETIIIKKLKENIIENKSELEIINSQIYTIKENTDEKETKKHLKKQQEEIDKLLKKIEKIKEQLNIYAKDDVIKDAIYLDSKNVIDDILDYKRMIDSKTSLKKEYEIIEEYGYILEEIEKVNDRCVELDKEKNNQLGVLEINQKEFEELEEKTIEKEEITIKLNDIVYEQEKIIKEFDEKIGKIDSDREILYSYDNFKKLMSLELKYIALLSLSPLKGSLPFIALTAKQTKDTIDLLLASPLITTKEKINYIATDYTKELENTEYTLNDTEDMLNNTKYSISIIKERINSNENLKSNHKYDSLITKIGKLEEFINESSSKVQIYKIKMHKNKEKNRETIKKVLILNDKI